MKFSYSARDERGQNTNGIVEATGSREVAAMLRQRNLTPISINQSYGIDLSALTIKINQISAADIANITRQLATMITAGLPLTDALNLLKVQATPALAPVLTAMLLDVQAGLPLSTAMAKHPDVFGKVYVALIKAGEAAGVMENILNRLADNLEKGKELRAKVQGALIYPAIILVGMIGVMILMMTVVVPKLTSLYADFGSDLPWATQVVVAISNFMLNPWGMGILAFVLFMAFVIGRAYLNTPIGTRQKDELIFKIPVVGPLVKQMILTEMNRTLSLLVGAGVSIVEALNIVSGAVGNVIIESEIRLISKKVERGFPMSIAFGESIYFPPLIGQMVAVGEETGKMDEVLAKVSHYFEVDVEEKVKGLTTAMEPIILMVLGVGVGFLMFAIIMPLYDITNKI